jgi:hypothetical protein
MDSNNFESKFFNFSHTNNFETDEKFDQDLNNFFNTGAQQSNPFYFYNNKIKEFLERDHINVIHFNIRSLKKNFETFCNNLEETSNIFNIICVTETWCSSDDATSNANLHLSGFNMIPLARKTNKRGGGVLIYLTTSLRFIIRPDMSISDGDKEVLTIEITTKNNKNILLSCCYRPPSGVIEQFNSFLITDIIKKGFQEKKLNYIIGDMNLDCFEYHSNKNIKKFYNDLFENGAIPLINRPTRVTATSASLIDNIITTDTSNNLLKTGIIKSDTSDHFPIFLSININTDSVLHEKQVIIKRFINDKNILSFKEQLSLINWNSVSNLSEANNMYNAFFKVFYEVYDVNFPKCKINKTKKSLKSPWVTKDPR